MSPNRSTGRLQGASLPSETWVRIGTVVVVRYQRPSASMIIVELNLGRVAGCLATDAIRALAQQVAGEQPLPFFAGDDLPRRRLPLGNYQGRAVVSHADVEVEFIEACFDLGPL